MKLKEAISMTESNCVEFSVDKKVSDKNVEFQIELENNPYEEEIRYLINFGDGQTVTSSDLKLNHTYSYYGSYLVSVSAQDAKGNEFSSQEIPVQLIEEKIIKVKINPKGSYLYVNTVGGTAPWGGFDYDIKNDPSQIDLASLGIEAGDILKIKVEGFYQNMATRYGGLDNNQEVGAVFIDSNFNFLNIGEKSSVNAITTRRSYVGDVVTDISQDFLVPTDNFSDVEVPSNASKILFTVNDDQFKDNFDPNEDLYVVLRVSLSK